jgi:hypothetical protein
VQRVNQGAMKHDQVFALYAMFLDFDEHKLLNADDRRKFDKLKRGVLNNYPDALPTTLTDQPVRRIGSLYSHSPFAMSVQAPTAMKEAASVMAAKLTHALFLRETGKILTSRYTFLSSVYQPQFGGTEVLTSYFVNLLPD